MTRRTRLGITALLVAAAGGQLQAREATDTPAPLDGAFRALDADDWKSAQRLFEQALSGARAARATREEAEARRGLGLVARRRGSADAGAHLEAARSLFEQLGDRAGAGRCRGHLAALAWRAQPGALARSLYEQALAELRAAGDEPGEAALLSDRLVTATSHDQRAAWIEEGLPLALRAGGARALGTFLEQQGYTRRARGEYAAALSSFREAALVFETAGLRSSLAGTWINWGALLREHGRSAEALELARRALSAYGRIGDVLGRSAGRNSVCVALGDLGRHREAVAHCQRAVELARAPRTAIIENRLRNLAAAYANVGQHGRALAILDGQLRRQDPSDAVAMAWLHRTVALAHRHAGRPAAALPHALEAAAFFRREAVWPRVAEALTLAARSREALGRPQEALDDVAAALDALEQVRPRQVPADEFKSAFGEAWRDLFGLGVRLLAALGRGEEALEMAERARARAFLDLLAARDLDARPAGSDGSLPSPVSATPATKQDAVRAAQRLDSTLLSYFVTPEGTLAWVVAPDGRIETKHIGAGAARLAALVQKTQAALAHAGAGELLTRGGGRLSLVAADDGVWRALYDLLIGPVRHALPGALGARLTIVPHGPLLALPFGSLRAPDGRYLLEAHALHYSPAVGTLAIAAGRSAALRGLPERPLLLGDPESFPLLPGTAPLPRLPGTRREVLAAAASLGGEARVLLGELATEENLRGAAEGASLLHLATHGIVRSDRPFESLLALRPSGAAPSEDGRLTARDLYALVLQARLVVLSACRSGSGRISSDGILGLTRGFFAAGAPAVVATLWDVADEPTYRIMSDFYRNRRAGAPIDHALRDAQLGLLRALRAGSVKVKVGEAMVRLPEHPTLWAGFVLLGEP